MEFPGGINLQFGGQPHPTAQLFQVLCNDEVKAALDAFTQDPILRFTTSFLQEVVAEGCKQKPSFQFDAKGSEEASFDGREEL